jgi:CRP/FNR family cyclic AMP-dependent transcriptional regulator
MPSISILKRVPIFASLGDDELSAVADKLSVQSYRAGDAIFAEGDPGTAFYIIETGQVKISSKSAPTQKTLLAFLADGDSLGELALIDGKPRSATATAMVETHVLVLGLDDFLDLLEKHPLVLKSLLLTVVERLRRTNQLVKDSRSFGLSSRLAKLLLELAERHGVPEGQGSRINLRLTQQDLADALSSSRVALNRVLRALQRQGAIQIKRQQIIVLRPHKLKQVL